MIFAAVFGGLLEKTTSWFLNISLATCTDETTMAGVHGRIGVVVCQVGEDCQLLVALVVKEANFVYFFLSI